MVRWFVPPLLGLVACWSSSREPAAPGGDPPRQGSATSAAATSAAATSAATNPAATNPADCPATTASTTADVCRDRRPKTCAYPNLTCRCEAPFHGGAPPDPNAPWQWHCAPAVRADGCPGLEPVERAPCRGPSHDCPYSYGYVIACKNGKWTVVQLGQPLP